MKTEKFQLRGNNPACARAFQLLRGRSHAQLRGNIAWALQGSLHEMQYGKD
jgi:hypothetical protein